MIDLDLKPLPGTFSLVDYRFGPELRKLEKLRTDKAAVTLIEEAREEIEHDPRTLQLLSGVRLTPRMCPKVFGPLDAALATLGRPFELEVYVHQHPIINASIVPTFAENSHPVLVLSSAAIEKLTPRELLFVIGHELGHVIYGHHKDAVSNIFDFPQSRQYPYQCVQLMSWSRAAEISADRVGLLCCQDFATAVRTFFKLASGLTEEFIVADLGVFWEQVKEANVAVFGSGDQLGGYASHPFSPYRIKALHRFWCWSELGELWHGPRPPQALAREQVEKQVYALVADMDPDYLKSKAAADGRAREFFGWAAAMVVAADGTIDDREVSKLEDFTGEEMAAEVLAVVRKPGGKDKAGSKCVELSVPLRGTASPALREQMLVNLVALAGADNEIDETEVEMIAQLCELMDLDLDLLRKQLQRYANQHSKLRGRGRTESGRRRRG